MFHSLSSKLTHVLDKIRNRGALTELDVNNALREIRIALLEADVALPVVKNFIESVREKAVGQNIFKTINPGEMVVKIVHDHLCDVLGSEEEGLNLSTPPPAVILMVGLQGSGKTTSSAKLGKYIGEKHKKKILMASLDIYRPAAQKQLEILGNQIGIPTVPIAEGEHPLQITERSLQLAKKQGIDVLILDTAGRLHIDEFLMEEIVLIKKSSQPVEIFLVVDGMTGQDAVNVAKEFNEKIGITGSILTRLDGDAKAGAALSMRSITGKPIKFIGVGEKMDQFEPFHPHRIAGRILDMGDIIGLVERAGSFIDQDHTEQMTQKIQKGIFDLNDLAHQIETLMKMGGISSFLKMLPGVGRIKDHLDKSGVGDKTFKHQIAIIRSMTKKERKNPKVLNGSRRKRIAIGAGTTVQEVNRLMKHFDQTQQMMKKIGKSEKEGGLKRGIKNLFMKNSPF